MIINRQRRTRVPIQTLNRFFLEACEILKQTEDAFTVCLVSEDEIARWNLAYRGKNGPTDVLSFRSEESARSRAGNRRSFRRSAPKRGSKTAGGRVLKSGKVLTQSSSQHEEDGYLGDIAIAPAVARRNAVRFGRSFPDEMRILILHGILHLLGYDHETDTGQMERRERSVRRALGLA
jgi:probable rRNA maturation factor